MTDQDKKIMADVIAGRVRRVTKKRTVLVREIVNWTLSNWIEVVDRARADGIVKNGETTPAAMRIENTMFTVGRYYGGMEFNKKHYTYFEPEVDGHKPNDDGSPYVAWLMVRDDFLEHIIQERLQKNDCYCGGQFKVSIHREGQPPCRPRQGAAIPY